MGVLAELQDETVAAAVGGSSEAINRVATAMNDQMRIMVYARLNPTAAQHGLVEELTQQSLESFLRGLSTLNIQTVAGLRSFSSTIVSRRVADYLRDPGGVGRGKAPLASLDTTVACYSAAGPLWQFLSVGAASPLSAAARGDQFQLAMAELAQLRKEYRTAITMAFFDQLSTAQFAEQMGISRQAASMVLLRAVKALRKRITGASQLGADNRSGC